MPPKKSFEEVVLQKLRAIDDAMIILADLDTEVLAFSIAAAKGDTDKAIATLQTMKDMHQEFRASIHAGWEGWADDDQQD